MKRVASLACGLLLAVFSQQSMSAAYLRVVSWNTLHAGWSGSTNWTGYATQVWQKYGSSSTAANGFDVLFAQEVMYDTAAASLASALTSVSGVNWSYSVTAPIGRSSYKERYAVIYRTDRVTLLSATVWSDTGDKFEREPQIVKLRQIDTGADFTFINWHAIFGTTAERQAEIQQMASVFSSVQSGSSSDQDVILLGDHNKEATATWWSNLTGLSPAVGWKVNDLTSINTSCAFASAYDHFWYQASYVSEYSTSGRDYIADMCTFRNGLSDHAPVYISFYSSSDTD